MFQMSEPVREAMEALSDRVAEQLGCKVMSCTFMALVSESAVTGELDKQERVKSFVFAHTPEYLNNAMHDLTLIKSLSDFAHAREADRVERRSHE